MQTLRSVDISAAEWRWVILISGILVTLTLLPYAWALASNHAEDDWQFMGMLANPKDGATYLSKIEQGRNGAWLFELRHTPERHNPAGFHVCYLMRGHAARLTGLSSVLVFRRAWRPACSCTSRCSAWRDGLGEATPATPVLHPDRVRVGVGLVVAADRPRPACDRPQHARSLPILLVVRQPALSAGDRVSGADYLDFLEAFRRGFTAEPTADNGGLQVMVRSMVLALIQPFALVPIGAALVAYLLVRAY